MWRESRITLFRRPPCGDVVPSLLPARPSLLCSLARALVHHALDARLDSPPLAFSLPHSLALDALSARSCAKRRLPRESSFPDATYYIAVHYVLSTEAESRPFLPSLSRAPVLRRP